MALCVKAHKRMELLCVKAHNFGGLGMLRIVTISVIFAVFVVGG